MSVTSSATNFHACHSVRCIDDTLDVCIAMLAVTAATAFTLDPTLKAVAMAYRAARDAVASA